MAVEIGSRWVVWGRPRTVLVRRSGDGGSEVLAVPDRTPQQKTGLKMIGRGAEAHHWTDWIPENSLEANGTMIGVGEATPEDQARIDKLVREAERGRREASPEAAADSARQRAIITPEKRLKNRVTSARHKLNHPEKHGRTSWSDLERAEIEATMRDAQAQLASMKEAT